MIGVILASVAAIFMVLLEAAFAPHLFSQAVIPAGLPLLIVAIALIERGDSSSALIAAFVGGVVWDAFSLNPLGWGASILMASVLLIKLIKQTYVQIPVVRR